MNRSPIHLLTTVRRLGVAAVTLVALTAVSNSAWAHDLSIDGRIRTVIATDPSFDFVSENNLLPGTILTVGYGNEMLGDTRLILQMHNAFGDGLGDLYAGSFNLDWSMARYMAGAEYGRYLFGFLHPFVRGSAGYSQQSVTLTTTGFEREDSAHDLALSGSLGLEIFTALGRSDAVTLGLSGEYGYSHQTSADFDEIEADEDHFDDDDPWTREKVNLGSLHVDGQFWDLGLTLRVKF